MVIGNPRTFWEKHRGEGKFASQNVGGGSGELENPCGFSTLRSPCTTFHRGEVRENTTVAVPLHHGAVKTPPWCRQNSTMVEWHRHHGEISKAPWCFFLLHRGVSSAFTTVEKFFHHGGVFLSPRRFPLLPNHFLYGRAGRFDIRQGEVEAFGLNFQICARGLGVSDKIFKFARAKAVCSPGSRIFHPPLLCAICS